MAMDPAVFPCPVFPGGVSLPILVNFTGVDINGDRKMIAGMVRAQVKSDVGFLPEIVDPQLATAAAGDFGNRPG